MKLRWIVLLSSGILASSSRASSLRGDTPDSTAKGVLLAGRTETVEKSTQDAYRAGTRIRSGIEELEKWTDGGLALHGALTDVELTASISAVTAAHFHEVQAAFVDSAVSRFVTHPGNGIAASFLKEKLTSFGFTVEDELVPGSFQQYGTHVPTTGNIIAYMKGGDLEHELVVFGAHYDSVNWKNTSDVAPGADDNGSGEAALLLIAEAIAKEAKVRPLRRSVVLVSFQAEEVGLLGSKRFVADAVASGRYGTPVAAIIADEISFATTRTQYAKKAIFETKGRVPSNVALVDTLAHQASAESGLLGFEVNYAGFGSDHIPFLSAGYPAVLLIERDNMYFADNFGHTSLDTIDRTDSSFGSSMTRLAARSILTLAYPAQSTNSSVSLR